MNAEIDALDAALRRAGEDIVLRRTVGTTTQSNIDVTCRAGVRGAGPDELFTGQGVTQTQLIVIISPTQIKEAQWPGGVPLGDTEPVGLPRAGDFVIVKGRKRAVLYVNPIEVDEIVRINMNVAG